VLWVCTYGRLVVVAYVRLSVWDVCMCGCWYGLYVMGAQWVDLVSVVRHICVHMCGFVRILGARGRVCVALAGS